MPLPSVLYIKAPDCPDEKCICLSGVAARRCNEVDDNDDDDEDHVEAEWGTPNLIGCVTREVTELLERSKNIEEGVGSDNSSFIANLVYDIEYNTNKSGVIPPGDISATVETVDYLAVVRQENADTTDLMYEELQVGDVERGNNVPPWFWFSLTHYANNVSS